MQCRYENLVKTQVKTLTVVADLPRVYMFQTLPCMHKVLMYMVPDFRW